MATYVKFNQFVEDMWNKVHDLFGGTDTVNCALSNTAPDAATNTVLANITQIANGNGYTTGGQDTQNNATRSTTTVTMTGVDIVWTASGGSMAAARYVVMYNDTPTSPADPLIAYWDYGSSITLAVGETLTVDFGASIHTVS